ncbi:MAG: glycosyltransferase family 4 protein [Planctomycetota bacterium]|jgi:glycosyltransferase involved in cell wall biosynthesis
MRIGIVHNRYRLRGGEDAMVDLQVETLRGRGHEVYTYEADSSSVSALRPWTILGAGFSAARQGSTATRIARWVQQHEIEVVHVHNWFPLLGTAALGGARSAGAAVVHTVHNYRLGCANGTHLRDGKACHLCDEHGRAEAVRHACAGGSRLRSRVWAYVMDGVERRRDLDAVDALVVPSLTLALRLEAGPVPRDRVVVVPNACPDPPVCDDGAEPRGAVFVGRLAPEKGVDVAIEAWRGVREPLTIVGSGPEEPRLRQAASGLAHVRFVGQRSARGVAEAIRGARFLVSPHRSAEVFGLTVIEAFASERPVLAADLGGPAELVTEGATGGLFPPNDPGALRHRARRWLQDPALCRTLGENARRVYEQRYTPARHAEALEAVYDRALVRRARGGAGGSGGPVRARWAS